MFGPGRYVPDPTEGIGDVKDLPEPQLGFYRRSPKQTPCPRCGQLASRHKSDQRPVHDLGDVSTGRPVDLLVPSSSHHCSHCQKYFNIDLSDLAPPGSHYTNRVIDLAVRMVVEDGLPYRHPPVGTYGAITGCLSPLPPSKIGSRQGGGKGPRSHPRRVSGVGA